MDRNDLDEIERQVYSEAGFSMSRPPTIPVKPEPLAALKARFPKAIEKPFDCVAISEAMMDGIERGKPMTPGQHAECVFDFENGVRMIASLDICPMEVGDKVVRGPAALHLSFSCRPDSFKDAEAFVKHTSELVQEFVPGKKRICEQWTPCARHLYFQP